MTHRPDDKSDGIASYGALLGWLIAALLLAGGLAYLLVHPFLLRIHRPLSVIPAQTCPMVSVPQPKIIS